MRIHLWPARRRYRITLIVAVVVGAVVIGPYLVSRAVSPWRRVVVHDTSSGGAVAPGDVGERALRVAVYNIAHGRGLAESNWQGGDADERLARLDAIAALLRQIDADVVVLNEVDFDASWSHGVNQAAYLADAVRYPYHAEQRNLDFRVLWRTWRFGNAVLSRRPIVEARGIDLPGYTWWETLAAGKKRGLACDIDLGDRGVVRVFAVHLSHRSEALRVKSADMLIDLARDAEADGVPVIIAGDLNATPPGVSVPGLDADDVGPDAIARLDASGLFTRRTLAAPVADHDMTFHTARPRVAIDWILIPADWRFIDHHVVPSRLSDHRPIHAAIAPP